MPFKDPEKKRAYDRKWRKENSEKVKETRRTYRQRLTQQAHAVFGSKCFVCGSRKESQIHRADGKPHLRSLSYLRKIIKNPEWARDHFWLLCRKCHIGKKSVHAAWRKRDG